MAQPSPEKNAAARAKLTGPFYNPEMASNARGRAMELRAVIDELTNAVPVPQHMSPSPNPFAKEAFTRTEMYRGRRIPSMYSSRESEYAIQRALSSANMEQEIARAAMALFDAGEPLNVQPAISGPYTKPSPKTSMAGPLGLLLDLLTTSPDLNRGEDAELAKKRGPAYANKQEYEQLLQQVLQQNRPLP